MDEITTFDDVEITDSDMKGLLSDPIEEDAHKAEQPESTSDNDKSEEKETPPADDTDIITIGETELNKDEITQALESIDESTEKVTIGDTEYSVDNLKTALESADPGELKPEKYVIDDKEYSVDEIKAAIQGNMRQQDYTKKTQELAEQRKLTEPILQLFEKFKENQDFISSLQEAIDDEYGEDAAKLFRQSLDFDPSKVSNPFQEELDRTQDELQKLNAKIAFDEESSELRQNYGVKDEDVEVIAQFALDEFERTGAMLTLEQAYKQMNYDDLKKKISEKNKPKPPKMAAKKRGVKDIKSKEKPVEKFEDVDISGYELFT